MLSLMSVPVYADDYQDGVDAYEQKDYKVALNKFTLLAIMGDDKSQAYLARMYFNGEGVAKNGKEAEKWLNLSAAKGNLVAIVDLAAMYRLGQVGVQRDYTLAYKWYYILVKGSATEYREPATIYMKLLEKLLAPEQIKEGQRMAREWAMKLGR